MNRLFAEVRSGGGPVFRIFHEVSSNQSGVGKKRIRQMMDAMGLISCEPLQTEYLPRQPEVPFVAEGSHVEIL